MRSLRVPAALALLTLGLSLHCTRADKEEDRVVRNVEEWGGSVSRDDRAPNRPVVAVTLVGPRAGDEEVSQLSQFKQLRQVYLLDARITSQGLKALKDLEKLHSVFLEGDFVTDATLRGLNALRNVRVLGLTRTRITDVGMY